MQNHWALIQPITIINAFKSCWLLAPYELYYILALLHTRSVVQHLPVVPQHPRGRSAPSSFQVVLVARDTRALLRTHPVMRHPPSRAGCSCHTGPAHLSSSAHSPVQAASPPRTLPGHTTAARIARLHNSKQQGVASISSTS